ncbi:hypothetical protein EJ06DRAFT_551297 [Trichodelitschia bisporula]|uniref:Hydrophobin n=1 Tax=Trichodelitschia bisporula TaxID=703511 RepID=A0A6G1HN16_9PEZI|nr:hypothetical protein EJ06DRAFT_551297 [Trichodelitschia bisporula]
MRFATLLALPILAFAAPQPLTEIARTPESFSSLETRSLEERATYDCGVNGGTPYCCQATFAGDLPPIISLAHLTGFPLNPNDVNCLLPTAADPSAPTCPGSVMCCQVAGVPLVAALYCQAPKFA